MSQVDIFSERGSQMRLNQQMQHLETIHPHDSLSTQMCMDCICDLKMSYKFFMQIKKAHVKLKSIHSNLMATNKMAQVKKSVIEPFQISAIKEKQNLHAGSMHFISNFYQFLIISIVTLFFIYYYTLIF